MGVAAMSCQPRDSSSARYHLERAKEMMEALKEAAQMTNGEVTVGVGKKSGVQEGDGEGTMEEGGDEFPYEEQLQLVLEHLQLLDAEDRGKEGKAGGDLDEVGEENEPMKDDEEWSTCDEEESKGDENVEMNDDKS